MRSEKVNRWSDDCGSDFRGHQNPIKRKKSLTNHRVLKICITIKTIWDPLMAQIGERLFLELPRVRLDGGRQAFRRRWGYDMGVPSVPEEDEDSSELSETTSLRDERLLRFSSMGEFLFRIILHRWQHQRERANESRKQFVWRRRVWSAERSPSKMNFSQLLRLLDDKAIVLIVYSNVGTTQGLLATDHVILNHGQVTWTTPELAPPLLTTTSHQREDVSALDRFNEYRCPTRRVFSGTGFELVTRPATIRYHDHSATAAS
ncbi:uncharacterized protein TNCV_4038711 [Trichonephila clavipes]|nr:uncharacterized protein TNCV_4038711 [Trichonephila clavipes]